MAKQRGRPRKDQTEAVMAFPVEFSNVNLGDTTARVGVSISRANLTVSQADRNLCCKRLSVQIKAMANGAHPGQEPLPGMEGSDYEIEAVADVKGFSASGKKIGLGLTFVLSTIDVETLSHFAKREGTLTITGVEEIPDGEESEDTDE